MHSILRIIFRLATELARNELLELRRDVEILDILAKARDLHDGQLSTTSESAKRASAFRAEDFGVRIALIRGQIERHDGSGERFLPESPARSYFPGSLFVQVRESIGKEIL